MSITETLDVLAPFEIWEVLLDDSTIKFYEPLVLKPEVLPPEEPGDPLYWTVEVPELDISAFGRDWYELWNCICDDIRMSWKHYVLEDDTNLVPRSKKFKEAYLALAEEVANA